MPRGIPNKKDDVIVAGEPMTKEELAAATARVEGKESPFKDDPVKPAKSTGKYLRSDGQEVTKIGDFRVNQVVGDAKTLQKFKRIMPNFSKPVIIKNIDKEDVYAKWISMTREESLEYQGIKNGKSSGKGELLGYDADHEMGLLEESYANSHGG